MTGFNRGILGLGCLSGLVLTGPTFAAQLQVMLPLGRAAYQTNEIIGVSVLRSDTQALPAADLTLTLTGEDASKMVFTFPVAAVPLQGADARATEHLHLNGWLMRPGNYTVDAAANGATAQSKIEVYSAQRWTDFKLIDWGRSEGKELIPNGQGGLGFNMYYSAYGGNDQDNNIRGGVDYMPVCTMSGGHQMDLRLEDDWSDPNVLGGGRARVSRRALIERTKPNCLGIHFYDEPGLTWWMDPVNHEMTNASVPAQMRSFDAAFGYPVPPYKTFDRTDPDQVAKWKTFAHWKTELMDAAWQDASFGVKYVKPDFMTATQSQYGWSSFSDGYYFQITRSLSVTSGHGGYHDWGPGYWHPSFTLEAARARDFSKPNWYCPTWYGNTTPDQFRLEQYLSFQTDIQGMMCPPDIDPMRNPIPREGVIESNKMMGRFGTVFANMPVTRGPVAILFSLSDMISMNTEDPEKYFYAHTFPHGEYIHLPYIATKLMQQNSQFVVDEDVKDGTLQANYKAVILNAVTFLDPEVIAGLERFAARGGLVLMSNDSTVKIQGATVLPVTSGYPAENVKKAAELMKKYDEMAKDPAADKKALAALKAEAGSYTYGLRASLQGAELWVTALKPVLEKAGIKPVFACNQQGISGTAEKDSDVEYDFAVNASHDFASPDFQLAMKSTRATIGLPADGRPVYDAIRGGEVTELKTPARDGAQSGDFSFGPGEMRVFARTARPIGKVIVFKPVVVLDTTQEKQPLKVNLTAVVTDPAGEPLVGEIPLRIRVVDALGFARYDFDRSTKDGKFETSLPLAANDPGGDWKVEVTELLNNTVGAAGFNYRPMVDCGAMVGTTQRAVYFGIDRENMKRFFRLHKQITLIPGASDYDTAAVNRFIDNVKPWGITCTVVKAAEMNKPEVAPVDDFLMKAYGKTTWAGPGGFDVPGPCVLFGNADDNPLIAGIAAQKVLPYTPAKDSFPGRGRGMLAWQLDSIRQGQESITVIAYDAPGMDQAVGSLYETVADQDPITPFAMPTTANVTPATTAILTPEAKVAWHVNLPDRAEYITANGPAVNIMTHDGTLTVIDARGKLVSQKPSSAIADVQQPTTVPAALKSAVLTTRLFKTTATGGNLTAIGYWGGTLQVVDNTGKLISSQVLPQDITGLVWVNGTLVVGQSDGQVLGLTE